MSRWRRLLANPYKIQTANVLLTRRFRRWLAGRRLKTLTPQSLSQVLGISGKPLAYYQNRLNPAFFFDPERISGIIAAIPDVQKAATIAQADQQAIRHTFSFRGSRPVSFPEGPDWRFAAGNDPDWNADLHRLDWLVTALLACYYTGDSTFAVAAGKALNQWWQANPPGSPPWTDPYEVSQRANTLCWIVFLGMRQPHFPESAWETALCALLATGVWLSGGLEFQTPNNHLIVEIIRLYQLGLLLPEYPGARRWRQLGAAYLPKEVDRQVLADGFHCELSILYHRIVLEALVEITALAQRQNLELPRSIKPGVTSMLITLELLRRPDGTYPLWGDSTQSDTLLRYDLLAAGAVLLGRSYPGGEPSSGTLWLLNGDWPQPAHTPLPEAHFWSKAGYAVLNRTHKNLRQQLMFDCGPFGLAAAPGHGHADCLSVTLTLGPQPVLIDSGAYSFRDLNWRRAFRGTAAHNTIVVDHQEQTPIPGFFGAGAFARPRVDNAILSDGIRFFDARHDGYTRLPQPVWHRRLLLDLPESGWLLIDLLTGTGQHAIEAYWHFPPEVQTLPTDSQLNGLVNGQNLFQMHWCSSLPLSPELIRGQENPPLGWLSEEAGVKLAAPVLRLSGKFEMPLCLVTLIVPSTGSQDSHLHLQRTEAGYTLHITHGPNSTIAMVTLGQAALLNLAPWQVHGTVFVCHQTPSSRDLILAGGDAITRDQENILSLARPSRGMIVCQEPDSFSLHGHVELPLELACPLELPVRVNNRPVKSVFDRGKNRLSVLM